jgi:hypothetical protein
MAAVQALNPASSMVFREGVSGQVIRVAFVRATLAFVCATLVCAAVAHCFFNTLFGQVERGGTGSLLCTFRAFQHGQCVFLELFLDLMEGGRLGPAVVFDTATNDTACIGNEVRNADDAPFVQDSFSSIRAGNVRSLQHEFAIQEGGIGFGDDIWLCSRDKNVNGNVDELLTGEDLSALFVIVGDRISGFHQIDQFVHIQSIRIVNRPGQIRCGNDNRSPVGVR